MDKGLDAMMAQNLRKPPMEGFFIPSPEACFAAQPLIAARGTVATPRARELLSLLDTGASREEAAALWGMSRNTGDVHGSHLRQQWRAL